jgi:hypothetical protein
VPIARELLFERVVAFSPILIDEVVPLPAPKNVTPDINNLDVSVEVLPCKLL